MFKQLATESDRACALVLCAWLDDGLSEFIKMRLVDNPPVVRDFFGVNRPLGTFSSRITLAYLARHFSPLVYENLEILRGIRNDFAHSRGTLLFSSPAIADRCKKLHLQGFTGVAVPPGAEARAAFTATALGVLSFLIEFIRAKTISEDGLQDYFVNHMKWAESSMHALLCEL